MKNIYTIENVIDEALKYSTKKDFFTNSSGHYAFAKRAGLIDQICFHMNKRSAPNKKWTTETLKSKAALFTSRKDFKKNSYTAYRVAVKMGLLDQICSHMPLIKNTKGTWTPENIAQEGMKYQTKPEFEEKSNSCFHTAYKLGIIDKVCSHMKVLWEPKWDLESVTKEALKYINRSSFLKNSNGAYAFAFRNGIVDQVCSHMNRPTNTSAAEQSLFDIVKSYFPKTQKLRDRKVKIEGKPHIFGFDLDIYIPELRKGIEFDGTYWHSVPGLLRSRDHWPQEDLENYHNIKDEYFRSKGIKILHVCENEWNYNKEFEIKKCLLFLGIAKE